MGMDSEQFNCYRLAVAVTTSWSDFLTSLVGFFIFQALFYSSFFQATVSEGILSAFIRVIRG
jgi:hypothetical protein